MFDKFIRKLFLFYSKIYGACAAIFFQYAFIFPSKVTFKITNVCNVDCHFCYNSSLNISSSRKEELSLDEWKKVVDSVPKTTVISFTGGEVFVYPKALDLIQYIGEKNIKASIVSNGTLLRDDDLIRLVDSGLYYFMVSLHGFEQVHNRIYGGKVDYFKKATETIKRINQIKKEKNTNYPIIGIKTVISPDNLNEILPLMKYCEEELNASHMYFNLLSNEEFVLFETIEDAFKRRAPLYKYPENYRDTVLGLIDNIYIFKNKTKMDVGFTNEFKSKDDLKKYISNPETYQTTSCNRPFHEIYIQPNGDIAFCLKYKITNLRALNFNLKELLKEERYLELLKSFKDQNKKTVYCQSCLEAPFKEKVQE